MDASVVGGGAWGRALAIALARAGSHATLYSRRNEPPPDGVRVVSDLAVAARSRLVVLAVPSEHVRVLARELGDHVDGATFLVHGVRGLVGESLQTISDVLREETPSKRVGALGGPVLAPELAAGSPSLMVVGSRYREVVDATRDAFASEHLRVYATRDLVGLEWASALVAAFAVAIGYAQGAGIGPGLVAAFTTRSVHEAARIAHVAGGEHATLLGLAGLGDLLAAAGQPDRPEVALGRALAAGASLEEARTRVGQRIEALELLPKLRAWTEAKKVRAPIVATIADGIFAGRSREEMIQKLMSAPFDASE